MQTMNISLPDALKEFVDDQIASGRYSSVSEYVRELIREDEKRKAQAKLEALLMEGIQSGESTEMTRQDWEDVRSEALARLKARKARKAGNGHRPEKGKPQSVTSLSSSSGTRRMRA